MPYNKHRNYSEYLDSFKSRSNDQKSVIKLNGFLVVDVSNLLNCETNTIATLVWDIGKKISEVM